MMITLREKLNSLSPERRRKIEGMVKELTEEVASQSLPLCNMSRLNLSPPYHTQVDGSGVRDVMDCIDMID